MTDHVERVREHAKAEALVEVGFWPYDLEVGDGKAIFADGAAWLASRLTRENTAKVLRKHVLEEPNGGTTSFAWCRCSCGYKVEKPGASRRHVEQLARLHVAQEVLALFTEADDEQQ